MAAIIFQKLFKFLQQCNIFFFEKFSSLQKGNLQLLIEVKCLEKSLIFLGFREMRQIERPENRFTSTKWLN